MDKTELKFKSSSKTNNILHNLVEEASFHYLDKLVQETKGNPPVRAIYTLYAIPVSIVANITMFAGKLSDEQFQSYILEEGVFLVQVVSGLSKTCEGDELELKTGEFLKEFYFILEDIHTLSQMAITNAQQDLPPRDALMEFFNKAAMHSEKFYGQIPNMTLGQFQLLLLGVFMNSMTLFLEAVNCD